MPADRDDGGAQRLTFGVERPRAVPGLDAPSAQSLLPVSCVSAKSGMVGYALPGSSAESFPKKSFPEKKQAK